jgi:hypothetical protein
MNTLTQTPAERRAAEAEIKTLIERYASVHQKLVVAVRRWLQKQLPTAHEVVYEYRDFFVISYSPSGHGYEGILGLNAGADGVKLFFNNARALLDPAKLLSGSGKLVRSMPVESAKTLKQAEVMEMIEAAIALNTVPFATEGKGTVIVRLTTAKKKRK